MNDGDRFTEISWDDGASWLSPPPTHPVHNKEVIRWKLWMSWSTSELWLHVQMLVQTAAQTLPVPCLPKGNLNKSNRRCVACRWQRCNCWSLNGFIFFQYFVPKWLLKRDSSPKIEIRSLVKRFNAALHKLSLLSPRVEAQIHVKLVSDPTERSVSFRRYIRCPSFGRSLINLIFGAIYWG